jgi:hypothetical protein
VFGRIQDQPGTGKLIDDARELLVFFREGFRGSGEAEGKAQLRKGGRAFGKQLQYLASGGAEAVGFGGEGVVNEDGIGEDHTGCQVRTP